MIWQFTILKRNNQVVVIDEPVGWDNNEAELKRDPDYHGIFFNSQGDTFEFYGEAMRIIKEEYDTYRNEGIMTIIMKEDCGKGFEEFSRGKFLFAKYEFVCGDTCYVKIPVETVAEVMNLRNRINQKVNLEGLVAFDEVTNLTPYNKLPFTMEFPSKGIFIQDYALAVNNITESISGGLQGVYNSGWNLTYGQIEFAMTTKAAEIGGFSFNNVSDVGGVFSGHTFDLTSQNSNTVNLMSDAGSGAFPTPGLWPLNLSPTINFHPDSRNYNDVKNPVQLGLLVNGTIAIHNTVIKTAALYLLRLPNRPTLLTNGESIGHYQILYRNVLYDCNNSAPSVGKQPGETINIGSSFVDNNFLLNKDDRLYFFITITERKTASMIAAINAGAKAFTLNLNSNSFFKLSNLSRTPATKSKVFAINEVISRVAESITNDKLRAYSNYFGRTDSQPYALPADGCGSMQVVTDGIRIRRQENKIPGKTNLLSMSLQDVFEGLNTIHNIGMGLEKDTLRPGYNRLRVEPWTYFYNTDVIMACFSVNKIKRSIEAKDIYSTFNFGYQKWEAEEYTGLDEFLTKRSYRTTLDQIKNDLIKLCKWIASGYALEITRRKGNDNSKDWRYDKDVFIICTTRDRFFHAVFNAAANTMIIDYSGDPTLFSGGTIEIGGTINNNATRTIFSIVFDSNGTVTFQFIGGTTSNEESFNTTFPGIIFPSDLYVELGNVTNSSNIIDPATLYNFRISPLRNAMRWMNKILQSYINFDASAKIIFTDGDGNYYAKGEMISSDCKLENGSIEENQTLAPGTFQNQSDAKPILLPERVEFEYPMSSKDFNRVESNPYGLIYFDNDCESGYGHIDTIKYKPEQGIASFNLIPRNIDLPPLVEKNYLLKEDGFEILTEDEKFIEIEIN